MSTLFYCFSVNKGLCFFLGSHMFLNKTTSPTPTAVERVTQYDVDNTKILGYITVEYIFTTVTYIAT
jgi:hypothetical protein